MAEKEDVLIKYYDFVLYIIPQLEKFPRKQKFLLADKIEILVLDIHMDLVTAYYSPKNSKMDKILKINLELEKLRFLIRLSHDLKYFTHERYGVISGKVEEIGKILGGWKKKLNENAK